MTLVAIAIGISKLAAFGGLGIGMSAGLGWFHSYEHKPKQQKKEKRGEHHDVIKDLSEKLES
jgi:CRISPR/Cas system CMR-associated protein Cmr1 (group 7 of RAMP superfamily)